MGQNKEKKDQLKKKENLSLSREAYEVVHKAFLECEKKKIPIMVALGAFLDKGINILIKTYHSEVTAAFLEKLAKEVRDGVYGKKPK